MDSCPDPPSRPSLFACPLGQLLPQHCLHSWGGRDGGPLQGQLTDHPGTVHWDEAPMFLVSTCPLTYISLLLQMPVFLFCFIMFCLSTLQSANSLVPTGQWNALFYDPKHWDFVRTHWYLVIGNRSWHFNRLQWVILHSPFSSPIPVALELIYEASLLFTYFIPHYSYLMLPTLDLVTLIP